MVGSRNFSFTTPIYIAKGRCRLLSDCLNTISREWHNCVQCFRSNVTEALKYITGLRQVSRANVNLISRGNVLTNRSNLGEIYFPV